METIITDINKLTQPAEVLKFIDDTGTHKDEGQEIINKLKETMNADENILALAAPQIGINKRIFCIRFSDQIKSFINPIYKKKGKPIISYETNPSFPKQEIAICRPEDIEVSYYSDNFKYEDNKFIGSAAKIFDQQYQILDGIIPGEILKIFEKQAITPEDIPALISAEYSGGGIVLPLETEKDYLTIDDLKTVADILGAYCDQFKKIGTSLKTSEDATLKHIYSNMKFQEDIITGKIQVVDNSTPKLNREQRRAVAKRAQKIKTKKAGK